MHAHKLCFIFSLWEYFKNWTCAAVANVLILKLTCITCTRLAQAPPIYVLDLTVLKQFRQSIYVLFHSNNAEE